MTADAPEFLDTNILVYAFSQDIRATRARNLLGRRCRIGVQSLNELANVMRRKLGVPWAGVRAALADVTALCSPVIALDLPIHLEGLRIAERYSYGVYDSLLIAAARSAGCATFWSEDLGDGVLIEGRMRIRNPFVAP
ncbi:MAG TPA: PIN domain-containing protein [Caulobacteraceae bacterium]|nr:PIN domain-containing protein [Caulobacteraceae bacterium]